MLSLRLRKTINLVLLFVLLFSLTVPFGFRSAYAAHKEFGSREFVRIAAGEQHSLALKADGTVVAWGGNINGQATVPVGLSGVISIAAGWNHSLALKADGTVVAWGNNDDSGQTTVPSGLSGVVSIAAGRAHSLALKSDGTVVAWGNNDKDQASVPAGLNGVVAIAAGWNHSIALKSDGTVVAWGENAFGQMTLPGGLSSVVSVAAGTYHSLALKADGTVVAWGVNNENQINVPIGLSGVLAITAGSHHSIALQSNGKIVAWGEDTYGQSAVPADLTDVVSTAAGFHHSLALKSDGTVVGWGDNTYGQTNVPAGLALPVKGSKIAAGVSNSLALRSNGTVAAWGLNNYNQSTVPGSLSGVLSIAAGYFHSLALKSDGTVTGWGLNSQNQITIPGGLNGVVMVAAGEVHSLALKSDGTVVAWGSNNSGQRTVPGGLNGVMSIAAGDNHSLALKSDGTVVAWGDSGQGQTTVPAGLSGVVSITAGDNHSLALKSDGTVVAWGSNSVGQTTVPAGLSGVVAISGGRHHSLALKSDGTVVAWGFNNVGQTTVPAGLSGVVSIAAGGFHSLALKSDGTIVAWGENFNGQGNIPGNANLSGLVLQEGDFTESFQSSVTSYTYYYDGHSLSSVHVTPTLSNTNHSALYVNNELLTSGSTATINLAGAMANTVIPVRVEPYLRTGQTYTITLAIDSTLPEVQFDTNGSLSVATTAASKVTVIDTESGMDAASLQYVWTQSTAVPTSGWLTFSDEDTLSQTSGDGNWYLHIRAADKVGNVSDVVSNLFVLDNTAPTATVSSSASHAVNAAFPVTITFSESVSGFTEDDFEVVNGTVSNLVSVSTATYTATITPATSGQAVTVSVGAGAAVDAVGNNNTASNTLSLLYDTTKPVVTFGGFTDHQQFATPPAEFSVTVSEAVYWIAGGAELNSANALPLISMKKDGQDFSAYAPSYDEPSRTFTVSFNDTLEDGVYEVNVAGNVVENVYGNTLEGVNGSFIVAVPLVSSISASPTSLPSAGGSTTVEITGTNLTGQTVKVYIDGVEAAIAAVSNDTSATAIVSLPYNSAQTTKNYMLSIYLNGVEVAGQNSTVTVSAAPQPAVTLSSNAELAKLNVNTSGKELGLSPVFTPGTTEYTAQTDAKQVQLQLSASHPNAIVKLAGERINEATTVPLAVGANVLEITIQAEDGSVKTYTLTINRSANNEHTEPSEPSEPSAPVCPFTDIEHHWAKPDICEAAELGIVEGVSAHSFVPDGHVTRTEFAVMLLRTLQIEINKETSTIPFSDKDIIPEWARLAIQTAVAEGILDGYSDGTLKPLQTVNRSEMAAMVSKAMEGKAGNMASTSFADDARIPAWAKAYVEAARGYGIIEGRAGNQFVPDGLTTRAEAAVVLLRLWKILD
ncbi:RCC1 domain-containing protein [Paenibacillus eucommiae]|uniref:Alpha-tubulin suppressor-like RCC1 family protein n=1 Tax=Paenibacillus eucommiae TaxID=1355755 RepID=A0ABS4IVL4_9BACL|nr:S-layer homology domain-containing protein [Paenibacillus eucommiae]MBP1991628.1 alpha-tubulin suppressor-like RCC1 family protein [Paenibacillus eucommiae]